MWGQLCTLTPLPLCLIRHIYIYIWYIQAFHITFMIKNGMCTTSGGFKGGGGGGGGGGALGASWKMLLYYKKKKKIHEFLF